MKATPLASYVVDTNVAIVANKAADVDVCCERACIDELQRVAERCIVVVDEGLLILEEYRKRLTPGRSGVGNVFFKHVWDNLFGDDKVRRVRITPAGDDRGFEELPPNTFDRSDRKFLATAVSGGAEVLNATDSDWAEHRELTDRLGVAVRQLCPRYATKSGAGA